MSKMRRAMDRAAQARERRSRSEDSVLLRGVVLAAVMVAATAVIAQGAVPPPTALGTLILLPIGFVFSYKRRDHKNVILKIALAAALVLAPSSQEALASAGAREPPLGRQSLR